MSHILFISPYYPPEKAAAAVCVSESAKRLAVRGHQVTVLTTFPNYPTGIVEPEYRGHIFQEEVLDSVRVVRVWTYFNANKGFLRRILAQLSFGCLSPLLGGKAVGQPDIIIVQSPPLFDAIAARMLAWWKCCPFIFMVSDLWPESAVQFGALRNRALIRLSEWLERSTYLRARLIWVVSEGVRDILIRRGLSPERIFLLHNGVDTTTFKPLPQAQARARFGWDECFTVLYAGTHGMAHGLKTILDAAEQMRDRTDIRFVFVGDGSEKEDLIADAQRRQLKSVTFLDPLPHEDVPLLLAAADLCLVPTRKVPLLETTIPLKLFEVMACARPILLGAEGRARKLAEQEAGAAIYVGPENPDALASAILHLYEHPEEAELLGRRGRAFVEARFDYDKLTSILNERIVLLLGKKGKAALSMMPLPNKIPETTLPISTSVASVSLSSLEERDRV